MARDHSQVTTGQGESLGDKLTESPRADEQDAIGRFDLHLLLDFQRRGQFGFVQAVVTPGRGGEPRRLSRRRLHRLDVEALVELVRSMIGAEDRRAAEILVTLTVLCTVNVTRVPAQARRA